jgi:glycosyltransferase involved in cell wall biosynthesis
LTTLVIQVPCLDEEATLGETLAGLPRSLPGIDRIAVLVVDDGSTDSTGDVARAAGAVVVRHRRRLGYARAFRDALAAALDLGADLIVNTDGDNQYPGEEIGRLVEPLLAGRADIVVGDRQTATLAHFSPAKRALQRLGTRVVSRLAGIDVADAASGFRAYTRAAALRLQVFTDFSPTLETLIQAGRQGLSVASVPIRANPTPRPSRLHRGSAHYLWRQAVSIARALALYAPVKTFGLLGTPLVVAGAALELRYLALVLGGEAGVGRHIHSVTVGGFLFVVGVLLWGLGLLADGLLAQRQLLAEAVVRLREASGRPAGGGEE